VPLFDLIWNCSGSTIHRSCWYDLADTPILASSVSPCPPMHRMPGHHACSHKTHMATCACHLCPSPSQLTLCATYRKIVCLVRLDGGRAVGQVRRSCSGQHLVGLSTLSRPLPHLTSGPA
jgi:hypothetical protein